ncbi:MAG: glycerol-3-phosphate acyltransferase, partial [Candidatus Kryptoniota bacterium]
MSISIPVCPLLIGVSYLVGSISSAILVTKLWIGKDIRTLGNGNAGTANVARSVGILPAAIVLFVDFSKGAFPVLTAHQLKLHDACGLAGAIAAVIGHSYPIYFRFRGGKGLAASLGALITLSPLETLLVLPVLGLVYLVITGSAVTGAIISFLLLIGLNMWKRQPLIIIFAPLMLLLTMGLCTIPQIIQDWHTRADRKRLFEYWLSPKYKSNKIDRPAIITDSIASLQNDLCTREHIYVVPLALILTEGQYLDGVNIDPRKYYQRLRQDNLSPKTSAPSPGQFQTTFQKLSK